MTGSAAAWAANMLELTPRGYTGHEHLDEHGLIHMNGRVYDPRLARFLQSDPFIEDTGTLNRYTYVHNNPLYYTDPSGYFGIGDVVKIAMVAIVSAATYGAASGLFASLGTNTMTSSILAGAAAGEVGGLFATGTMQGAFIGAVSGGFAGGIAAAGWQGGAEALGRAFIGGAVSHLQGGKFGHGFAAAGVSSLFSPSVDAGDISTGQIIQQALIGGAVSQATGGKFANGAGSAATAFVVAVALRASSQSGQSAERSQFVVAEDAEPISSESARSMFNEVTDALALAGEDVSNIHFNPGYGYSLNGRSRSTNDFSEFERRAYGRGGRSLLGEYNPANGEIIIYRNAFSSRIPIVQTALGTIGWEELNASAGFASGLFVVAHEIGHRVNRHSWSSNQSEFQANMHGLRSYREVCEGEPRC